MKRKRWLLIGGLVLAAPMLYMSVKGFQILRNLGGGNVLDGWYGLKDPLRFFKKKDRVVVLVIGKDYSRDSKGMPYTKDSRADTIMMLGVDMQNREISAVSVPRDLRVTAPDGKTGKINGTYVRGKEKLLIGTLEELFDVKVDYHVALKPDAVKNVVDALGGVEVNPIDFLKYKDHWGQLDIDIPKGKQRITGSQAVGYSRFREVNTKERLENGTVRSLRNVKHSLEEGDNRRTARQQELLRSMVRAGLSPNNLMQADRLIDVGFKQVETNLTQTQLTALATIFKDGVANMHSYTLDATPQRIGGLDYMVLDERKGKAMVDWLIKGDEEAANRAIRVAVYNGTSTKGLARLMGERLKKQGFDVVIAGNTPKNSKTSLVFFNKAAFVDRAETISDILAGEKPTKYLPGEKPLGLIPQSDLLVIIGEDVAKQLPDKLASAEPTLGSRQPDL